MGWYPDEPDDAKTMLTRSTTTTTTTGSRTTVTSTAMSTTDTTGSTAPTTNNCHAVVGSSFREMQMKYKQLEYEPEQQRQQRIGDKPTGTIDGTVEEQSKKMVASVSSRLDKHVLDRTRDHMVASGLVSSATREQDKLGTAVDLCLRKRCLEEGSLLVTINMYQPEISAGMSKAITTTTSINTHPGDTLEHSEGHASLGSYSMEWWSMAQNSDSDHHRNGTAHSSKEFQKAIHPDSVWFSWDNPTLDQDIRTLAEQFRRARSSSTTSSVSSPDPATTTTTSGTTTTDTTTTTTPAKNNTNSLTSRSMVTWMTRTLLDTVWYTSSPAPTPTPACPTFYHSEPDDAFLASQEYGSGEKTLLQQQQQQQNNHSDASPSLLTATRTVLHLTLTEQVLVRLEQIIQNAEPCAIPTLRLQSWIRQQLKEARSSNDRHNTINNNKTTTRLVNASGNVPPTPSQSSLGSFEGIKAGIMTTSIVQDDSWDELGDLLQRLPLSQLHLLFRVLHIHGRSIAVGRHDDDSKATMTRRDNPYENDCRDKKDCCYYYLIGDSDEPESVRCALYELDQAIRQVEQRRLGCLHRMEQYQQQALLERKLGRSTGIGAIKLRKLHQMDLQRQEQIALNLEQSRLALTGAVHNQTIIQALALTRNALRSIRQSVDDHKSVSQEENQHVVLEDIVTIMDEQDEVTNALQDLNKNTGEEEEELRKELEMLTMSESAVENLRKTRHESKPHTIEQEHQVTEIIATKIPEGRETGIDEEEGKDLDLIQISTMLATS